MPGEVHDTQTPANASNDDAYYDSGDCFECQYHHFKVHISASTSTSTSILTQESSATTAIPSRPSSILASVPSATPKRKRRRNPLFKHILTHTPFLHISQRFNGTQVVNKGNPRYEDKWTVNARIQGVDLDQGLLCGVMEALNVPNTMSPVLTFWEGEIVDNKNHFFKTGKWKATKVTDMDHWARFKVFEDLKESFGKDGAVYADLMNRRHVFMRWKERFFMNNDTQAECGLSIEGFYYMCVDKLNGSIEGFYYDPLSTPFQELCMEPQHENRNGFAFPDYELN
eukprot:CAMPEP_0184695852 /NCGR_PEP_ID=MMETSP0313-20130426/3351_1 /TAXON_ID=2792 /ORGANISM="Porphyridium aerugineum, Strain SAG 1380-2" /LENGTH=283 /DNA_ID=CAMNT_0027154379 /DNA_START=348 /DNA_END=1199 /DNA_ORIENTATION=+